MGGASANVRSDFQKGPLPGDPKSGTLVPKSLPIRRGAFLRSLDPKYRSEV